MRKDSRQRPVHDCIVSNEAFADSLHSHFNWFTGVPDSMYTKVIPLLSPYHFAPRENHAVAMAFGASLGGAKPCVLMQNSGLGLCLDALLGLQRLYQKGLPILVTQRGELEWEEVQHKDWSTVTVPLLKAMSFEVFDFDQLGLEALVHASVAANEKHQISVVLIHRGNLNEQD